MPTVEQILRRNTSRSITITCAVDGRDHLVSDRATTAGLAAGHGRYTAACGRVVVAAPMVAPPGPSCSSCVAELRRITAGSTEGSRRRRRGVMAWLLHRRPRPAHSQSRVAQHRAEGRP
ncbi:MAG: hypothetical protein LC799_16605 [Actinobacteria bacterium]|nr:hypothetical protein [Actinomycetota bacterium]